MYYFQPSRKILILLTDGTQTVDADSEDPVQISDELRSAGVTVLVVGVGPGVNTVELSRLAGGTDNTFIANSFNDLVQGDVLRKLTEKTYQVGEYAYFGVLGSSLYISKYM